MKKTKSIYKMYPAWGYEREIRNLEEQSKSGWHLVKGGLFHCKFAFDDSVQYRYALDFDQDIADPARYRETFAEQGWEFINSTFNGWHYFRKVYDPTLPEAEYQIYTDTASLREMENRWKRLAYILGGLELVLGIVNLLMNLRHPAIHSICLGLGALLIGVLLVLSTRWMGRQDKHRSARWLLIPIVALFALSLLFVAFRTGDFSTTTEYIVPADDSAWQICFEVKLPDVYTLDVRVDAQEPVEIAVVKTTGDGELVGEDYDTLSRYYAAEGTQFEQSTHLFLTPGTYVIYTQYLPGAEPGRTGQFVYELN